VSDTIMTVCRMTWCRVKIKVMEVWNVGKWLIQTLFPLPVCM